LKIKFQPCQTFYKKESTQKRERKGNKGQGPKSRQANSPTKASCAKRRKGNHQESNPPILLAKALKLIVKIYFDLR
jgi:hypothetical protein